MCIYFTLCSRCVVVLLVVVIVCRSSLLLRLFREREIFVEDFEWPNNKDEVIFEYVLLHFY